LTNCTISGNSVGYNGGGLANYGDMTTLTNCTISGNSSSQNGGGVGNKSGGTTTLTNCNVNHNSASSNGGGLDNQSGTVTLIDSTVSGNSAGSNGAGLYTGASGTTTLSNGSTVSGNSAVNGGGGLANFGGVTTLTNCTVSGNSAVNGGGGLASNGGTTTLTNSTVSGNSTNGGGLTTYGGASLMAAGLVTVQGPLEVESGTLTVEKNALLTDTGPISVVIDAGGTLAGSGTINGNVQNSGVVSPGTASSTGILTIHGNYTQTASGTLAIRIGGNKPGTQFDQLQVSGSVSLAGTLSVSIINGFVPAVGDHLQVLDYASHSGQFGSETVQGLGSGESIAKVFAPKAFRLVVVKDVTSPLQVVLGGLQLVSSHLGLFRQTITITNTGTTALQGPLALLLQNLSPNATERDASGLLGTDPFLDFFSGAVFQPGQSIVITLRFFDPSLEAILFNPVVLQGQ